MVSLLKVLHIDTEMSWRGGENQIRLLLESAQNQGIDWYLAAPPGSEAILRMSHLAKPIPVAMKGLGQISAARHIAKHCVAEGIQLIDCQSSRAHQLGLMIKLMVPSIKLVVHRRVDYAPGSSVLNRLKYTSKLIDRYVAISQAIADILIDYGISQEKISVVRSAVDPSPFQKSSRAAARAKFLSERGLDLKESTPIIANVAYITEQKGHETLIRALGYLKESGQDFCAFIAGDGDLRGRCEALAKELQLEKHLYFLGIRKDVPDLLAASDIFALSSNDEGLGTSLLDATYSGCALVATAVGGIPEIVLNTQTGFVSPAKDAKAFSSNLQTLCQDPNLRLRLAANAREHVLKLFSLEQMVLGNLTIYHQLISRN